MVESKQGDAPRLGTKTKIKEAARRVFMQKGFAATRTRDIAEAADINLALLNYHFKSKEKLFELVMSEKVIQMFSLIEPVINNEETSLKEKIQNLVDSYIDLLLENPELPMFVFSEFRADPEKYTEKIQVYQLFHNSSFVHQLKKEKPGVHPLHFVTSLLGVILFPFMAKPILFPDPAEFRDFLEERRTLIPDWVDAVLRR